jgi:hypothetical protein
VVGDGTVVLVVDGTVELVVVVEVVVVVVGSGAVQSTRTDPAPCSVRTEYATSTASSTA